MATLEGPHEDVLTASMTVAVERRDDPPDADPGRGGPDDVVIPVRIEIAITPALRAQMRAGRSRR